MYEKWQKKKIRFLLKRNNILESIDRRVRVFFRNKIISFRNILFMKSLPNITETQEMLSRKINSDLPFALIRFGLYEYILCYQFLEIQNGLRKEYSEFIRYHIKMDAGLFNNDDKSMNFYAISILENLKSVDIIAYWRNIPDTKVFEQFYSNEVAYINVENIYPYPFLHKKKIPDWQKNMENKNVLVVSAFTDTIGTQYEKREKLWNNSDDILPQFKLLLFKAVQTNAGRGDERFTTWQEALNYMVSEILKIDFDIALISCGCYGMPLAIELKKQGRKAIQWGGCFQLWFGIRGERWENNKSIRSYINKYWVFPSAKETPFLAKKVDNSCYWSSSTNAE